MITDFDIFVIGGGPAGLTTAVYASRANLKVAFVENKAVGGKIPTTAKIENWPGDSSVEGPDLAIRMYEHALSFGASYIPGECVEVVKEGEGSFRVEVKDSNGSRYITSKTVVVASGMINRKPPAEGIVEYENRGVSYCVICDGALYKDNPSAIIGDGNSAVEEAIYLAGIVPKVYVIALNKELKAEKITSEKLISLPNVEVFYQTKLKKILGDNQGVSGILVDLADGTEKEIKVGSVFPYIGFIPVTKFLTNFDVFDRSGFILTDENMETSVKGLFAVGDVRTKAIRQITTAAADGTIVAKFIANNLSS